MGQQQRREVLEQWSKGPVGDARAEPLHPRIAQQAARTPGALAVQATRTDGTLQQLTYAELMAEANRLAHHLLTLGAGPERVTAILLDRSAEMIVALLAALQTGGAYLPLDPGFPTERLTYMLRDAGATIAISQGDLAARLDESVHMVNLDNPLPDGLPHSNPAIYPEAANPAYIIYTSGSTGRPKGVVIPHRAIANYIDGVSKHFDLESRRHYALVSTIAADLGLTMVYPALSSGGCLHVLSHDGVTRPEAFAAYFQANHLDYLKIVPSHLAALHGDGQQTMPRTLLVLGGEASRQDWIERLRAGSDCRIINHYGPTEATVGMLTHAGETNATPYTATLPLGAPLLNTKACLLDRRLQPVPAGMPAELMIGGVGLARGYHNRAGLTAASFIPDPYAETPGDRLYKSGDLCRRQTDGAVVFLGRIDHQLKLRGYRIELAEIETALQALPAVNEALVVIREDVAGDPRLAAYVTLVEADPSWNPRQELARILPEHMLPSSFSVLEAWPLTANGKIDRRALPLPQSALPPGEYSKPRNPDEAALAEIWAQVLNLQHIGIHANFFELGGHSLLGTRLISRIRTRFSVEIPLRTLFASPTVAALTQHIQHARHDSHNLPVPPIEAVPRDGNPLPLSLAQERLWFLTRLEGPSTTFNMPMIMQLAGSLDRAAFQSAVEVLIERHEILRTSFHEHDERAVQRIQAHVAAPLSWHDLSDSNDPLAQGRDMTDIEMERHYDLGTAPLFNLCVIRIAPEQHLIALNMHHIISDGWSRTVYMRELGLLYSAFIQGLANPLQPLPVQYADYAAWQRNWFQGPVLAKQLDYWREQLGDLPVLQLPTDRPRPAVLSYTGGSALLTLNTDLVAPLRRLCEQTNSSLFMALLSVFKILLGRYSGQRDIVVGAPIAGRNHIGTEDLIGFFINTLVLRGDLTGNPSCSDLLARIRDTTLAAYDHQDLPFARLVEELAPERDLSRNPLFQVFFNMINLPETETVLPGLSLETATNPDAASKFDLTVYVGEVGEEVQLSFTYNSDLFDRSTIDRFLEQYRTLICQFGADPSRPIEELDLLNEAARAVLPNPMVELERVWPGSIGERLAMFAEGEHRIAVECAGESWSYRQVLDSSRRLANRLRGSGVLPGDVVAVYAARDAGLVIALAGILEAGAAFTILDPAYPVGRLVDMVDRAKAATLLDFVGQADERLTAMFETRLHLPSGRDDLIDWLAGSVNQPVHTSVANDLAWLSFTSGTSGRPRAVLGELGPLCRFLDWQANRLELTHTDRFTAFSGLGHDPLLRDIFAPLWSGATLCLANWDLLRHAERLAPWMIEQQISCCHLTPAFARLIRHSYDGRPLSSLRLAMFGGERLTSQDVTHLREMAPQAQVYNFYGATETPQAAAFQQVSEPDRISLGRGISGSQLLVLNEAGRLAGIGEKGEIHVRGPLARGYAGEQQLTQAHFIRNPFTDDPADRLYRTGDLGYFLDNGEVAYTGRADNQISIRGFRVEPAEIEAVLADAPQVAQAVVLPRGSETELRLVAYVVPTPDANGDCSSLRGHLAERLPAYAVPSDMVFIDQIPLTPNGKLDMRALPVPRQGDQQVATAPRNNLELRLVNLFEEVLGISPIGIHDSFFNLGGHSFLAVRLVTRIEQASEVRLPLACLFANPSVAQLALVLEEEQSPEGPLVSIRGGAGHAPLFCVHPLGGNVLCYEELARLLDHNRPFYGLQSPSVYGKPTPPTVGQMATLYLNAIRDVQPRGPYHLAGWSFGGLVAYEMARALHEQGEEVAFLGLLDSHFYSEERRPDEVDEIVLMHRMAAELFQTHGRSLPIEVDELRALDAQARRRRMTEILHGADVLPVEMGEDVLHHLFESFKANQTASIAYHPAVYPGRVYYFMAEEHPEQPGDRPPGWDALVGELVVRQTPGSHRTMCSAPHVSTLAESIEEVLKRDYS